MDIIITSWLGYIVAAITSLASIFLYRKQEAQKRSLENMAATIKNESSSNDEYRKLIQERNDEVRRKDEKLDQMYKERNEERLRHQCEIEDLRTKHLHEIDVLRSKHDEEVSSLRSRLDKSLENDAKTAQYIGLYHGSRCDNFSCPHRTPPLQDRLLEQFNSPVSVS